MDEHSKRVKSDINRITNDFFQYVIDRTSSITRYNTRKFINRQSVLEHEGAVATMAMVLSDYFNDIGIKNDGEKVMRMALLHDVDEVLSGDIPHNAKYQSGKEGERLRDALNLLNDKTVSHTFGLLKHEKLKASYMKLLAEEREKKSTEAMIVKIADFLDVVIYTNTEISMGNASLHTEHVNALKRAEELIEKICSKHNSKS